MNTEYRPRQSGSRRGGRRHRRHGGGDYNPQDSNNSQSQRTGGNSNYVDDRDYKKNKKPQSFVSSFIGWVKRLVGFKAPTAGGSVTGSAKGGKDAKPVSNGNVFTKEKVRAERAERVNRNNNNSSSSDSSSEERSPRRGGKNQPRPIEESDFTPARSRLITEEDEDTDTDIAVESESEAPAKEPAPSQSKQQRLEITNPKLFVGNLSYDAAESDLYDLFSKVGKVKNVEVVKDRNSKSKGFAFVEMEHLDSAKAAAAQIDQTEFMGRNIRISGAKSDRQ